jgi:uncharacterized coiled-coil DUF342 family protein
MNRDEFVAKFKQKLDQWNADIGELEQNAGALRSKMDEAATNAMQELNEKRDDVEQGFQTLRRSVGDAWHDLSEGLSEAGEDLHAAIQDARDRFRDRDVE